MNVTNNFNIFSPFKLFTRLKPKTAESKYFIKMKTENNKVSHLKNSEHVPNNAETYSMVCIGKKSDPNFERNVVSFYKDREIIKRIISGTDIPARIRTYKTEFLANNDWSKIVKCRYIKTKEHNKLTRKWETKQEETQFIHHFLRVIEGNSLLKKLHINKNVHDNENKIIHASITEYPGKNTNPKQEIKATLKLNDNIPEIVDISNNTKFDIPTDDKFLPYRFLVGEQKQTSLTDYELKKNGLDNLGIEVFYSKEAVAPNSEGFFDSTTGNIIYRELSKEHPIIISSHEAEHARQYSLIGRLGKLKTDYGFKCQKQLPEITDSKTREEGFEYVIASENYPKLTPDEDIKLNKLYWENGLEVGARNKSEEETKLYEKGQKPFLKFFSYSSDARSF